MLLKLSPVNGSGETLVGKTTLFTTVAPVPSKLVAFVFEVATLAVANAELYPGTPRNVLKELIWPLEVPVADSVSRFEPVNNVVSVC